MDVVFVISKSCLHCCRKLLKRVRWMKRAWTVLPSIRVSTMPAATKARVPSTTRRLQTRNAEVLRLSVFSLSCALIFFVFWLLTVTLMLI